MPYSSFTIKRVRDEFGVEIVEREGLFSDKVTLAKIYGAVTSGNLWKFLKLEGNTIHIDLDDYGIKEIGRITGILSAMIEQKA